MTTALDVAKADARKAAFAARKAAREADLAAGGGAAPAAATQCLAALDSLVGASDGGLLVAGYRPIRTEIDPTPLMIALHDQGVPLAAPVVLGEGRPLGFRAWTPSTPMTAGAFGAEIPAEGDWVEPTVLIAPLLAFDGAGYRLGYGGGFYDRTLEALSERRPTRAIGLAYAAQRLDHTPRGPTDRRLDAIATELGLVWPDLASA